MDDSVRTYAYAILGTQARSCTSIIGSASSFDAQSEFVDLTQTLIDSYFYEGDSFSRYQEVLQYARSAVNYSFSHHLNMATGNMLLHIGNR